MQCRVYAVLWYEYWIYGSVIGPCLNKIFFIFPIFFSIKSTLISIDFNLDKIFLNTMKSLSTLSLKLLISYLVSTCTLYLPLFTVWGATDNHWQRRSGTWILQARFKKLGNSALYGPLSWRRFQPTYFEKNYPETWIVGPISVNIRAIFWR